MSENGRPAGLWWVLGGVLVLALLLLPAILDDDDADASDAAGFDAYIQSGTCASPTDELEAGLDSDDGAHDVRPYVAVGDDDEPVTLGYYGAPELNGVSVASIYSGQQFSMVITDVESEEPVACGDVLRSDAARHRQSGLAVVQLAPVGSSEVNGVATLERTSLQRELVVAPARARIILSTEAVTVPDEPAAGYEGHIQSGRCDEPDDDLEVDLESDDGDDDVMPFEAFAEGSPDLVTVAYYGSPGAPGFGLAATYTDQFSMVLEDADSGEAVACGDLLEPEDDRFSEAGLTLVQLSPTGDAGVQGWAVVDRVAMERELDVTPAQIRILLFTEPIADQ